MKKFQKNQIVIYVIALMLVTAGYLNYIDRNVTEVSTVGNAQNKTENIGEATLVSNNETVRDTELNSTSNNEQNNMGSENRLSNNETNNASSITQEGIIEDEEEEVETNSQVSQDSTNDNYFVNSKLEREKMYSQMLETYQNMLNNTNISEEQKSIATQEITKINNTKNSIMICENLILNKNFKNVIIFVNTDSINVVVQAQELKQEEVAQIQNILTRELNCSIEKIHIMTKN